MEDRIADRKKKRSEAKNALKERIQDKNEKLNQLEEDRQDL